jgi:hypothetical protein
MDGHKIVIGIPIVVYDEQPVQDRMELRWFSDAYTVYAVHAP